MKTKMLVAAFACLSVFAAAQQAEKKSDSTSKTHEIQSPRDAASGQASGRRMNQKAESDASQQDTAAREASSGQATGKTMANDDWSPRSNAAGSGAQMKNVSTGDVSGDQTAVRESPSKASTGLRESPTKASTGLRESPTKASTGKTAVADVDGDGAADKTAGSSDVKSPRDAASGQASGKRQHEPVRIIKEVEPASPKNK